MKPKTIRKRLDLLLVERGIAESAKEALAMVLAGEVRVDGERTDKAGTSIAVDAQSGHQPGAKIRQPGRGQAEAPRGFQNRSQTTACLDIGPDRRSRTPVTAGARVCRDDTEQPD
jgi:23S rRNA (cytidine1920-2'-O)/16S rRNA (cytidine1409-2'-O)-methyltransferase